jgi:hypothetical protein
MDIISMIVQFVNVFFLACIIAVLIIAFKILLKLNKVLNIWLKKNDENAS